MKIAIFSAKKFELPYLKSANVRPHELQFITEALGEETAALAAGAEVVSIFAGDDASAAVLERLHATGVRHIAVRAAGYDNVALEKARELGIAVANVPAYSPYAIAEHAVALMLALNRKLVLSNRQVHAQNYCVDALIGFDMHGKTAGIIGTGKIGGITARILHGFGCKLLAHDLQRDPLLESELQLRYVDQDELCASSDIITLHTPLTPQTAQMIDMRAITRMKAGVMLINTSRGALVKTEDVIAALQSGHIGSYGADVYERERGLFFYDKTGQDLHEPLLMQLLALPNVLVTPHQAFATREALTNIADATFVNIDSWADGKASPNEL